MMPAAHAYCDILARELEANAWLQSVLLARLSAKLDQAHPKFNDAAALIKGRTFRPALSHLYLLRHSPFRGGEGLDTMTVEEICRRTKSDGIIAKHYYESYAGTRLPRPLLRNVLSRAMSNGSADNVLTALELLQLVASVPCDRGGNNIAIQFQPDLFSIVESWIDIKAGGVEK